MEKSKHKKPSTQKTKAKSTVAKSLPPPTPAKTKSSKEKSRRKTKPKYKQEKTKEQIKENLPNYDNVEYDLLHYEDDDVINTTNTEMENSDEDDDDVSVADTMYSKRMRFTDNWVHDHSNSNSYLSLCDELEDELDITTHKEYGNYLKCST